MSEHAERAAALRAEAHAILDRGLRALLESCGTLTVHGSAALDLMVWRDLDLYLAVDPLDVEAFFVLGARMTQTLPIHRMHFRDEREGTTASLPRGLYWGAYLHNAWKIDLWALASSQVAQLMEYEHSVAARLTPESRETILRIKSERYRDPEYRRTFSARDIYEAVLG